MSNDTNTAAAESATETSAADTANNAAKKPLGPIILAILTGVEVDKADFGRASYAFARTPREAGPKILTKQGIETARDIASNEKATPEQRESNAQVVEAHDKNLETVVSAHKAALITILSTPIGAAKDEHPETKAAFEEIGPVLYDRLIAKRSQPGLERNEEKRSKIIVGVANDVYNVIKDKPEFADLKEAAETRQTNAKERLTALKTEFEAKFPKEDLQKIRMIGLISDYQNDPTSLKREEKESLVLAGGKEPIFVKGKLTPKAKDRLNALQADEKTPEWLGKQIKGIFGKDAGAKKLDAIKKDVGPGL